MIEPASPVLADYIWTATDAVPDRLCQDFCSFIDKYQKYAERSHYGKGENTNCRNLTLYERLNHSDEAFVAEYKHILSEAKNVLGQVVDQVVRPQIRPLMNPVFSPLQLRKMFGPTRSHFDNVSPTMIGQGQDARFASRIVTLIVTLSESRDTIVFPRQERTIHLSKGSVVLFPPYWMYDHYTTCGDQNEGRYSLMTWLNETSPVFTGEAIGLDAALDVVPKDQVEAETTQMDEVCVFRLPEPLKRKWWDLAAEELLSGAALRPGFEAFIHDFTNFASRRGLPLTKQNRFDVIARPPGEASSSLSGLACLVNLGDEPSRVMAGDQPILLEPGDGCWVTGNLSLQSTNTLNNTDLEVLLTIGAQ